MGATAAGEPASDSVLVRALIAFEHRLGADGSGHPTLHTKRRIHPFSGVIRGAMDLDELIHAGGRPPMEAILAMRQVPPGVYPEDI